MPTLDEQIERVKKGEPLRKVLGHRPKFHDKGARKKGIPFQDRKTEREKNERAKKAYKNFMKKMEEIQWH